MNVKKQHILTKGAEFSFLILFLAVPPLLPQGDVTAGQSPGIHVTLPGGTHTVAHTRSYATHGTAETDKL